MAARSVRYGGGVWRKMEEARVALERSLAAVSDENAKQSRRLQVVALARDLAIHRVGELERRAREQERRDADVQRALLIESQRARSSEDEARAWRQQSERLEQASCESKERVESLTTALGALEIELTRAKLEVTEAEHEAVRLRDLLYDAQETAELLERRRVEQERRLRVLQRSTEAKARQVGALTRDKHELAHKLAQLRSGGRLAVNANAVAIEARPPHPEPEQRQAGKPSAEAKRETRGILQRTRTLLEQERQRSAALSDRLRELELDRRALVERFREASAARRRAQEQRPPRSTTDRQELGV